MRYLGLDLGSRTLGMAISDPLGIVASNYDIIRHDESYEELVDKVMAIVDDKKIDAIVLGLPKNMNNTIGVKGELSFQFKDMLENRLHIPVYLEDERLTTRQAENILLENNTSRKKRKRVIDGMAATIILQSYLDKNR